LSSTLFSVLSPAHAPKGGMSANAFGGHSRLDKCNLQGSSKFDDDDYDVVSGTPGVRTLWVYMIKDAANDYLFFGLGRNGSNPDEFWSACEFLFNVRASKPQTWQDAKIMRETYLDKEMRQRVTRELELSDEELKGMCLDSIWDHLNFGMPLDMFIEKLQAERKALLKKNWQQVAAHLNLHQDYSKCETALVAPEEPDVVTDLLYATHSADMAVAA
jgi:hypothetical protein